MPHHVAHRDIPDGQEYKSERYELQTWSKWSRSVKCVSMFMRKHLDRSAKCLSRRTHSTYHVIVIEQIHTTIDAAKDQKQLFGAVGDMGVVVDIGRLNEIHPVAGTQLLLQDLIPVLGVQDVEEGNRSDLIRAYIAVNGLDTAAYLFFVLKMLISFYTCARAVKRLFKHLHFPIRASDASCYCNHACSSAQMQCVCKRDLLIF